IESAKNSKMFSAHVALAPDGKTLVCPTPEGMKLWNIESGENIKTLPYPKELTKNPKPFATRNFRPLEFTADGKLLVAFHTFQPSLVIVWNIETGTPRTSPGHNISADVAL